MSLQKRNFIALNIVENVVGHKKVIYIYVYKICATHIIIIAVAMLYIILASQLKIIIFDTDVWRGNFQTHLRCFIDWCDLLTYLVYK